MTLKILGILIPIPLLCFTSESRSENIKENPSTEVSPWGKPLPQDSADHQKRSQKTFSQDAFSKGPLNHLQDIHNFNSIFDDPYFGGISYERVG